MDLQATKLLSQQGVDLCRASREQHARCPSIQAMDDPRFQRRTDSGRFGIAGNQVVGDGVAVTPTQRERRHSRRLVHGDDDGVFVEDSNWQVRLRKKVAYATREGSMRTTSPGRTISPFPARLPLIVTVPRYEQLAALPPREPGQSVAQKDVEPRTPAARHDHFGAGPGLQSTSHRSSTPWIYRRGASDAIFMPPRAAFFLVRLRFHETTRWWRRGGIEPGGDDDDRLELVEERVPFVFEGCLHEPRGNLPTAAPRFAGIARFCRRGLLPRPIHLCRMGTARRSGALQFRAIDRS